MNDLVPKRRKIPKQELLPSKRVMEAIDAMVERGITRNEAATIVGFSEKGFANQFRKHHCRAYFHAQLRSLREATLPRNFWRLDATAESSDNDMARCKAIQLMDNQAAADLEQMPVAGVRRAGFVMVGAAFTWDMNSGFQSRPAPPMVLHRRSRRSSPTTIGNRLADLRVKCG